MHNFAVTKWYLDCVGLDGSTAIAYWTNIAWRGPAITWHSLAVYRPGADALTRSSARAVPAPGRSNDTILWQSDPLNCRLTCQPFVPAFAQRLLDTDTGTLDWRCEAAAGDVLVECDGREVVRGRGYAECLSMTLPPWRLPIDELRWGRWISDVPGGSMVWIDWRGSHPLTAIFVDGRATAVGAVGDEIIDAGGTTLTLHDRHTLYSRSLVETIGPLRPVLAPLLPHSWLALEDGKWRSRGTRSTAGGPEAEGWVIHETVRFPR
jgi:hypothetical protein